MFGDTASSLNSTIKLKKNNLDQITNKSNHKRTKSQVCHRKLTDRGIIIKVEKFLMKYP